MIIKCLRYIYNLFRSFIGILMLHKNKYCNVIYFHDVVNEGGYSYMKIEKQRFISLINYLVDNDYNTLKFDDLNDDNNLKFKRKNILIAFDDGWLSNYTEIFDFMQSKGVKYNIFLSIKSIGTDSRFLNWEQVAKMHESGIVGFGTHTYNHVDASNLNEEEKIIEFNLANEIFEAKLGYKAEDFCYPFGYYSEEANEYLSNKEIYKRIYTSEMMYSYRQNNSVIFGRNAISNDYSMQYFIMKLNGYMNNYNTLWRRFKS